MRYVVYGLLLLLYALHTDVWFWDDPRLVLGLPIGITYHVLWTLLVSVAYWLVVRYAWPNELDQSGEHGAADTGGERDVAGEDARVTT